ncbi:MAG: cyclodeaminase/cyclohydrolase family protein [Candidatus Omnitrophica bacterium]|nr:cyclodeaminase/cyclohydrolase family protein [Candidatus Omnitrophota bacterium]MDD5436526.1 cyclodeaminase/cyclohydrolase family protein [Candidatus Omnitrophota bacterium]
MYINGPIKDYLNDLAAKKPAPGGGSAAALAGAIGVSLMSMVANYTAGNPKYKVNEAEMADILKRSEKYRAGLQALIDKDVEAYARLSSGMKKVAKDSPELDKLFKEAMEPPFEMCKIAAEALGLCKRLVGAGNKNLITDTAIAAIMLESAFFSAKFNVYINLKYIKDIDFVGGIHKVLSPLEKSIPELKEEILEMCEDVISR